MHIFIGESYDLVPSVLEKVTSRVNGKVQTQPLSLNYLPVIWHLLTVSSVYFIGLVNRGIG